jgi:hypothetical protein
VIKQLAINSLKSFGGFLLGVGFLALLMSLVVGTCFAMIFGLRYLAEVTPLSVEACSGILIAVLIAYMIIRSEYDMLKRKEKEGLREQLEFDFGE